MKALVSLLLLHYFLLSNFCTSQVSAQEVWQHQLLASVNAARKAGCQCGGVYMRAVPPLRWDERLARAAQFHAAHMYETNNISHVGAKHTRVGQRVSAAGYSWRVVGENLAFGYVNPALALEGWLRSPGHCRNIMAADFVHVGLARRGRYYVMVLASPW
ncbi:MAG: hypothetical protein KatS3mg030_696 [Saprospiraceae bacterium]|nr:MAG: hypothetical protein KatS3mg030_696 [Saprospiraceae bacterium]